MIILLSTDTLSLITSDLSTIDVHASWLDNAAGLVSVGRENTTIMPATTTDIVAAPPTGTQRNVRTLHVRNRGSLDNTVTVVHFDGAVSVELYREILSPDSQFQYNDGNGFTTAPV